MTSGVIAGYIMGPIGMAILYRGFCRGIKYHNLLIIGFIAASLKFTDAFFFKIPFFAPHIVKPALAIMSQTLSFTFILIIFNKLFKKYSTLSLFACSWILYFPIYYFVQLAIGLPKSPAPNIAGIIIAPFIAWGFSGLTKRLEPIFNNYVVDSKLRFVSATILLYLAIVFELWI